MSKPNHIQSLLFNQYNIGGDYKITYKKSKDDKKPLTISFTDGKLTDIKNFNLNASTYEVSSLFTKLAALDGEKDSLSLEDLALLRKYFGDSKYNFLVQMLGVTNVRFDAKAGVENIELGDATIRIDIKKGADKKAKAVSKPYARKNPKPIDKMKPSHKAKDIIKDHEKCVLYTYDDKAKKVKDPKTQKLVTPFFKNGMAKKGTLTIGYGHTGADVKPGMTISQKQADKLLEKDLAIASESIKKYVKVPLTQNEFDALTSFVFNVGEGNFKKSSLLRYINEENFNAASNEFNKWVYSKGEALAGLTSRRDDERSLFRASA